MAMANWGVMAVVVQDSAFAGEAAGVMRIAIRAVALELGARHAGMAFPARLARAGWFYFAVQGWNDGTAHRAYDGGEKAFLATRGGGAAAAIMEGFLAREFLECQAFGFGDEQ